MKISIKLKLIISYVTISVIIVSSFLAASNLMLERQFQKYVTQNQEQLNLEIVNQIAKEFEKTGTPDEQFLTALGENALDRGIVLMVNDTEGKEIFCMSCMNTEECENMIMSMEQTMVERYPNWSGEYTEKTYQISSGEVTYGTAVLGYYGPFYYNNQDLEFIDMLNRIFFAIALIFLIIAAALGYIMAKRIAKPVEDVILKTAEIGRGRYHDRIKCDSDIKELNNLVGSVNNLANNLEMQQSIKKRMAGDFAHEFRTPLTSLRINREGMIDGILETDSERLEGCLDEINRLTRMVSDIDKLVEIESESLVLNMESFNLNSVVENAIKTFEGEAKKKNICFEFSEAPQEIIADRDKMSQVFVNLISNAVKYTDSGTIKISFDQRPDMLEIKIRDTGIGISEKDLPHIFEYLYRSDESRSRNTGGSGIGLSIVKSIITAHAGRIYVQSEPGKGTEFTIEMNL